MKLNDDIEELIELSFINLIDNNLIEYTIEEYYFEQNRIDKYYTLKNDWDGFIDSLEYGSNISNSFNFFHNANFIPVYVISINANKLILYKDYYADAIEKLKLLIKGDVVLKEYDLRLVENILFLVINYDFHIVLLKS